MISLTLPGDFDLEEIFIGREQQLDLFHMYLDLWKREMAIAPHIQMTTAPSPNNKIQGLVVLLYGRAGFGKSTLLKHYWKIAQGDAQKFIVSKIVDWEFAIEGKRSLFSPAPSQGIDAPEYFRLLCSQLANALSKRPDDFREYRAAVKDVEEARKQASSVLKGLQKDDRYAGLRWLAGEGAVELIRWVAPRTGHVLDNKEVADKVKEVIGQGAEIGAEQLTHAYLKLRDRLGHKLYDYLEPALRLGLAVGRDLYRFARNFPLLIFFDTYEEIDEGDNLLRLVMGGAGARVGWVLAGRDNLWAGSEQRNRSLDKVYGLKEVVRPGLGLEIVFNTGDVGVFTAGAFTASDIMEYFSLLRLRMSSQLALPTVTAEKAERILEATQGVPLAVRIAASLYLKKADLAIITEKADGKREIVDEMVQRYVLHAHDNQSERTLLYGLALMRRATPTAIAAVLNLSPQISFQVELSRLHRRYSFIFTKEDEQPSLQQEVRYFLRLWLLRHCTEPEIVAIIQRLKETSLAALEELHYTSLGERLADDRWVERYLDLTELQFWLDPAEGVKYALPFMAIAGVYYRIAANQEVTNIGKHFEAKITNPYRMYWEWAVQSLVQYDACDISSEGLIGLEKLVKLTSEGRLIFPPLLSSYQDYLVAALKKRLGRAYQGRDNKRGQQLDKEAIGSLIWDIPYDLTLSSLELKSSKAIDYYEQGNKYLDFKLYNLAVQAFDCALKIDSRYAYAYNNRGIAYANLTLYWRAIQDFNQAIELKPDDASAYVHRGITYRKLKEYKRSIEDFDLALRVDPKLAWAYYSRGITYLYLKDIKRARTDFAKSMELDPTNIDAQWMNLWCSMLIEEINLKMMIDRLQLFVGANPNHSVSYICLGVALGLQYKLESGLHLLEDSLKNLEHASRLDLERWDTYFWKGMVYAHLKDDPMMEAALNTALEKGLPPILLKTLKWLRLSRKDFFEQRIKPLLDRYEGIS